jgi:antitoxin PrlF
MLATLTSNGQLTLPKAVRDALDLKAGQRFQVDVSDAGELILKPLRTDALAVRGILKSPHATAPSLRDMDASIKAHLAAKHARRA